jgi:hypothetical protein
MGTNGGMRGRTLDSIPPAARAEVMATAIISIALSLDGEETLSRVVLPIAAASWATLASLLPLRAARGPARFWADARTPRALTAAVATAVLGTQGSQRSRPRRSPPARMRSASPEFAARRSRTSPSASGS